MAKQIEISTSPISESFSPELPEKRQTTFHDILPSHCITTADRSASTYYGKPKFKRGIRRFTEPAASSTANMATGNTERQKQAEKSSAIRRSTLQTTTTAIRGLMKVKSRGGSTVLSRLLSTSPKKGDEENRKDTVYEYDSDDSTGKFKEEHKR